MNSLLKINTGTVYERRHIENKINKHFTNLSIPKTSERITKKSIENPKKELKKEAKSKLLIIKYLTKDQYSEKTILKRSVMKNSNLPSNYNQHKEPLRCGTINTPEFKRHK